MKWITAIALCISLCAPANAQITDLRRNVPEQGLLAETLQVPIPLIPNYRNEMRSVIWTLAEYAKGRNPDFINVAREGLYLLSYGQWEKYLKDLKKAEARGIEDMDELFVEQLFDEEETPIEVGTPIRRYVLSLDGLVIDNFFCGENRPDSTTMSLIKDQGYQVLGIDHCGSAIAAENARIKAVRKGVAIHADANSKDRFRRLPEMRPNLENSQNIVSLPDVRNMLVLTDTRDFGSRRELIFDLTQTNYDLLVIDPFYGYTEPLTKEDVAALKYKNIGAKRLVLAYFDVSLARDVRYYWENDWSVGEPSWLRTVHKKEPGSVITEYWNPAWKQIVGIYFKGIMDLGFDGVVYGGLDRHLHFEQLTPIE